MLFVGNIKKKPFVETLPTVDSINKSPKKFKAMSFFSGIGGATMGLRLAGYDVIYANEFIPVVKDMYKLNWKTPLVDGRDIRKINGEELLADVGLKRGELDLLEGSPPCKSFSTFGSRDKLWGKECLYSENVKQRTDDLFDEQTRIIDDLQPKVFMLENVQGLTFGKSRDLLREIYSDLSSLGYYVDTKILYAWQWGISQNRPRLIIMGVRKDLGKQPVFPIQKFSKANCYTVQESIEWLEKDEENEDESTFLIEELIRRSSKIVEKMKTLKIGEQHKINFGLQRNYWDRVGRTLTASDSIINKYSLTHSFKNRKHTIKEAICLSGCPLDIKLIGNETAGRHKDFERKYERFGRIHIPYQVKAVAENIRKKILEA